MDKMDNRSVLSHIDALSKRGERAKRQIGLAGSERGGMATVAWLWRNIEGMANARAKRSAMPVTSRVSAHTAAATAQPGVRRETPGILEIAAGTAPNGYQAFAPATMVMLAPPAYVNQYGMPSPISAGMRGMTTLQRETARRDMAQREASDFFRLRAAFDAQMGAQGYAQPVSASRYPRSEITYKQREGDVTRKLLSQQTDRPRMIDMQLKHQAPEAQGAQAIGRQELNKLSDKLYDMLESRIRTERFRHGY